MKGKIGFLTILFVCLSMGFVISCGSNQATDSQGRPVISPGERALAAIEVQNVFSKHCYYHENGLHRAEMEDIWVKKDGENAATAKWTQPMALVEGYDNIWKYYVDSKETTLKRNLEAISQVYPEIQNVPENLGIGGEWASHVQTTPIIEVAGDGKTAKGIWYSPGLSMSATVTNGQVSKRGGTFWEKYAADFANEDGEWKIWHIAMFYENSPPGWNADTRSYETAGAGGRGGAMPAGGARGGEARGARGAEQPGPRTQSASDMPTFGPPPDPYQSWSPTKMPKIAPRFPEPYYTFSETFSY